MTVYIVSEMGKFYVEPPSALMSILFADLSVYTPLIFVLSQGADPTNTLLKFAEEKNFMEKLFPISLGQGMGPRAEKLIVTAMREGQWVLLQNHKSVMEQTHLHFYPKSSPSSGAPSGGSEFLSKHDSNFVLLRSHLVQRFHILSLLCS